MNPPRPLLPRQRPHSALPIRVVPKGTTVLGALIGTTGAACSATPDSLTPSNPHL